MSDELAPCPCGQVPEKLCVEPDSFSYNRATVRGYCCGEWNIEFRTHYNPIGSEKIMLLAREAWNSAPRGKNAGL